MVGTYIDAVAGALNSLLDLCMRLALPLSIVAGLALVAFAALAVARRPAAAASVQDGRRLAIVAASWVGVFVLGVASWAILRTIQPLALEDVEWRQSKEATANPVPDAPPVEQYGPSVAALVEKSYTRTLTLPPDFMQRVGTDGLGVIAPYMTDPTAENVLRLVDTFRRSGKDVVFTREATRLDEEPIPLARSSVSVKFRRIAGRAYEAEFEGRYVFGNNRPEPTSTRMIFPLPGAGTVRDVSVSVGGETVAEPNPNGAYEWKGTVDPSERKEAICRYRVVGARSWRYDLGSQRRRVEQFQLDAAAGGPVKYLRGSLQPSKVDGSALRWDLANVVTAQRIAMEFPPDSAATECYLQALAALPGAFIVFLVVAAIAAGASRQQLSPAEMAEALLFSAVGLAAAPVLSNYLGSVAGLLMGPLAGAVAAASLLRGRSALAVPAALIPAAFLSPQHSGLIVTALVVSTVAAAWFTRSRQAHLLQPAGGRAPSPHA